MYQIQIGGIGVVVEVEGEELEETVMDSPIPQRPQRFEESVVEDSVRNDADAELIEKIRYSIQLFFLESTKSHLYPHMGSRERKQAVSFLKQYRSFANIFFRKTEIRS